MKTPNYHDFYQRALIPMGINDLMTLEKSEAYNSNSPSTHWLIAVEGVQLQQPKIYFNWKVSIYPADCEGDYTWKKPFYCSPIMECMDDAISLANSFVGPSQSDELCSSILLEKIC